MKDTFKNTCCKMTKEYRIAMNYADEYKPEHAIAKKFVVSNIAKIATFLGCNDSAIRLICTFVDHTNARDWNGTSRPIVWLSNQNLCDTLGKCKRTIQNNITQLMKAGLIHKRDSVNGKRHGRRDSEGNIVYAYGFDLSPIAVRYNDLKSLVEQAREQNLERQTLRKSISATRQAAFSRIQALDTLDYDIDHLESRYNALTADLSTYRPSTAAIDDLPALQALLEAFDGLLFEADEHYIYAVDLIENAPKDAKNCTHNITTTTKSSFHSNKDNRTGADAPDTISRAFGAMGFEEKPDAEDTTKKSNSRLNDKPKEQNLGPTPDYNMLKSACPHFTSYIDDTQGDVWYLALEAARKIAANGNAQLNNSIYDAVTTLGRERGVTAFALAYEKNIRGEVKSTSGYIDGILKNAAASKMNLQRSLFGLINAPEHTQNTAQQSMFGANLKSIFQSKVIQ